MKEKRQQKRGRGKSRHQPVGGAETMADDGEREGGNKVERGRARVAGQMGRGWTQSSSAASIPVQAGTSRSYTRGEVPPSPSLYSTYSKYHLWTARSAAQQLAASS